MITEGYATFDYLMERGYAPVRCWIHYDGMEPSSGMLSSVYPMVRRRDVVQLLTAGSNGEVVARFSEDGDILIHDHSRLNGEISLYRAEGLIASDIAPDLPEGDYFPLRGLEFVWATDEECAEVFGTD